MSTPVIRTPVRRLSAWERAGAVIEALGLVVAAAVLLLAYLHFAQSLLG